MKIHTGQARTERAHTGQAQLEQAQPAKEHKNGRRSFLKQSSLTAVGAVGAVLTASVANVPKVHAAENNTLNIALVGCGSRGTGALFDAMQTEGPKKVVALADVFRERMGWTLRSVTERYPNDVDVPQDRQFEGFEGYKKAIDAVGAGGVVLLASPPVFRPRELEYAAEQGVHVFAEKSFAVDSPGVRRTLAAGKVSDEKNLKVVSGLMQRHKLSAQMAIEQIHAGVIGEVTTCLAYRIQDIGMALGARRPGESLLSHQMRHFNNFTWLFGSPMVDWLIHNLDVCCWAKEAYPVVAQGQCARQVRRIQDQLFDQYYVEYTFPDGTRLLAQGRYIPRTWNNFQSVIHGTTGCAVVGEGVRDPRLFRGHNPDTRNMIWEYTGPPYKNEYQAEHDTLFDAIRNDKPHNETERAALSSMVGVLGRLAAESGQRITWEDAINSNRSLANIDELVSFDSPAPVKPDENGDYPFPIPGLTEVL